MPALVSVLIPCFNAERYIGETLESVLGQEWPALEIVVVDDGSTDGSVAEVERFRRSNLRLVRQANQGQTAALNTCLRHATGEVVQYLDADDLLDRKKISTQMERLQDHPDAVCTAEWARFTGSPEEAAFVPEQVWTDLSPLDWLALSRADGLGMMFPAIWLMSMKLVRSIGPWDESLSLNNDAEYFTRMVLASDAVLFCPGARCYYRSGVPGSLSGRKTKRAWRSQLDVLTKCQAAVLAREDSERMRRGFSLAWQHAAHAAYAYDRAIAREALANAAALHPIKIRPEGGRNFRLLSRLIGWRAARRLQVLSGRT